MAKVNIVFSSCLMLWDFRQVFRTRVVKTLCFRRTLVCVCTETEIELAIHAYHAKVISDDGDEQQTRILTSLLP